MKRKIEVGDIYTCDGSLDCCYLTVIELDKMNVEYESYICHNIDGDEQKVAAVDLDSLVYNAIESKKNKFQIEMNKILKETK
jgi:uncharacterized cysteine cluster protein YcgN (CxxCxxCC family)